MGHTPPPPLSLPVSAQGQGLLEILSSRRALPPSARDHSVTPLAQLSALQNSQASWKSNKAENTTYSYCINKPTSRYDRMSILQPRATVRKSIAGKVAG